MIPTLLIGIGNPERGDDAAGLEVARRVRARGSPRIEVRECQGGAAFLLESWRGRPRVILVDAASGGLRPGAVRRFEAHREPLPGGQLHASSHAWGVAEAVELARTLGELPDELVVYAIEGRQFGLGHTLSPRVRAAVARVEKRVLEDAGVALEERGAA